MKKLCFSVLAVLITAGFSFAQIKVAAPHGNVGIGTETPAERLHIQGSAGTGPSFVVEALNGSNTINFVKAISGSVASAFFYAQNNFFAIAPSPNIPFVGDGSTEAVSFTVRGTNGNVGIGTWSPTEKLDVRGNIVHSGTIMMSDARVKKSLQKLNYGLEEIMQLSPVFFEYNGKGGSRDGAKKLGLLAQQLQRIAPELVTEITRETIHANSLEDKEVAVKQESYLAIKDNEVKYLLLNAIKEQQKIITALEKRISEIETKQAKIPMKEKVGDW